MTTHAMSKSACAYTRRETLHDCLLVSSFCIWATVLGLTPVLAFQMLTGS
jgi:hypothetical protein